MRFAKQMAETKEKLEGLGHKAEVPCDIQKFLDDPGYTTDNHEENFKHCLENDILRRCLNSIGKSDAILVLNYPKNGINGHIGTNTLIDMGVAYYLGKKIFLLNHPPDVKKEKSTHEVLVMQPVILDGDFSRIK